jgi:hypothetical protein
MQPLPLPALKPGITCLSNVTPSKTIVQHKSYTAAISNMYGVTELRKIQALGYVSTNIYGGNQKHINGLAI